MRSSFCLGLHVKQLRAESVRAKRVKAVDLPDLVGARTASLGPTLFATLITERNRLLAKAKLLDVSDYVLLIHVFALLLFVPFDEPAKSCRVLVSTFLFLSLGRCSRCRFARFAARMARVTERFRCDSSPVPWCPRWPAKIVASRRDVGLRGHPVASRGDTVSLRRGAPPLVKTVPS